MNTLNRITVRNLLLFSISIILISCHKESSKPASGRRIIAADHIVSVVEGGDTTHEDYTYDGQGRISKIAVKLSYQTSPIFIGYSYQSDKIVLTSTDTTYTMPQTYYLDSKGRIIKSTLIAGTGSTIITYSYNDSGQLSEVLRVDSSKYQKNIDTVTISYDSNGNLHQMSHRGNNINLADNSNSLSHYITTFTQTSDKLVNLIGYESALDSFEDFPYFKALSKYLGISPADMIASYQYTNINAKYIYKKDSKGNIISMAITVTPGGRVDTFNFTYNCQ